MNDYRALFKKALKDPQIKGLECICPSGRVALQKVLKTLPDNVWVSEWRYGMGIVSYRYYLHINGLGLKLKKAYDEGKRAGHPFFTGIFSKQDLESIAAKYEEASEVQVNSA
ncbi:hypothetical protein HY498_03425 [Candidatus Woesearchaeota archaeon]|nr:hypothetical protein [Candidatus Woesearchaeota archaeon]